MFQLLSDRPTCLNACVITGSPEGGTQSISQLKHLCVCLRLCQMSCWQEHGTTWNIRETVVITLDTPDKPGYQGCCSYATGHHQPPSWLQYHGTAITQRMFQRCCEVDNPFGFCGISGFAFWRRKRAMWYWWSVHENSLKYKTENTCMKTSLQPVQHSCLHDKVI